jgi:uncharacterized membrane protein YesL
MNPFLIFWRAGRDLFDELFVMIGINLLWALMCCPLLVLAIVALLNEAPIIAAGAMLLNVLLVGPASAGLFVVAERVIEGRVAPVSLFFEGMRTHRVTAWQVYGIWTAGLITLLFNLAFYLTQSAALGGFATFLIALFAYLTLAWITMLIYLGPLIVLQQERRLRLLWRNAAIMTFGRPVFTLVTAILMGLIIALSVIVIILPLLLTFAMLALWGMRAAQAQIASDEERRRLREQGDTVVETPTAERGRAGQVRPRK